MVTSSNAYHLIAFVVVPLGLGTNLNVRPRPSSVVVRKDCFLGFKELKKTGETRRRRGILCKGSLKGDSELDLEREILEFMKNSRNPEEFPTKKELLDAGRIDLVNAIVKKGGWLSLGWDDFDDDSELTDIRDLQTRPGSFQQGNEENDPSSGSCSSSNQSASSSGGSLEGVAEEDTGIEGILSRLEKHRNLCSDIRMEKNVYDTYASSMDDGGRTDYMSPDASGEIYYGEKSKKGGKEVSRDEMVATRGNAEHQEKHNEINTDYIKSRLQHMQLELSSALGSLRSKSHKLSDIWEFHENDFMKAQDKLRSIRAELAVLEGEMALSIMDAQKIMEEKQRRIDGARRTLQVLRTTCIIWPNSATEVLLAGSFDGWTTQRKMERSKTGVFSLSLKLYPGTYEIKFVVDGVWRVDPLRPIVDNNGYENNLLIVHEMNQ